MTDMMNMAINDMELEKRRKNNDRYDEHGNQ